MGLFFLVFAYRLLVRPWIFGAACRCAGNAAIQIFDTSCGLGLSLRDGAQAKNSKK